MSSATTDQTDAGTVVRLAGHRRFRAAARPTAQVAAYWHALRAEGDVPARAAIDPRGIDAALPHTFILERVAPRVARLRVAGHALCEMMGMELRGMPLSALFSPGSRDELGTLLTALFERPATCRISLLRKRHFGFAPLRAQAVLLPLRGHDGRITHALGAIEIAAGKPGTAGRPNRFDLAGSDARALPVDTTPASGMPPATAATGQPRAFAEPPASFDAAHAAPRLRLVKTGD